MSLALSHRAPRVVVVSNRVHEARDAWREGQVRMHVHVVRDIIELDKAHKRDNIQLTVLDAALPTDPGRSLTAGAAAHWLSYRGSSKEPVMVWLDGTVNGHAMGEEVGETLRASGTLNRLAGVACGRTECLTKAAAASLLGRPWQEPMSHLLPNPLRIGQPILYNELSDNRSFVGAVILDIAARPHVTWQARAVALNRSYQATRNRLHSTLQPALVKLGWIAEQQVLNLNLLVFLVTQRYEYIRHFVWERRPDLRSYFAPPPLGVPFRFT